MQKVPIYIDTKVTEEEINKGGIYLLLSNNGTNAYIGQASKTFQQRWKTIEGNIFYHNKFSNIDISESEWFILEFIPQELENDWIELNKIQGYDRVSKDTRKKYKKLFNWLDNREIYWIDYYRKKLGKVNVYNISAGGKGTKDCYFPRSEESLRIAGEHISETKQKQENKERYSKTQKEICNTPERIEKSRERQTELWKQEEFRKKTIDGIHAYYDDPNNKEEFLSKVRSEEYRSKQSKISKERFKDQNERKKLSDAGYKRYEDPDKYDEFRKVMQNYSDRVQQEQQVLNDILYHFIQYDKKIEKYGVKRKWKLIFKICDIIHILNNNEHKNSISIHNKVIK